MIGCVKSRKLNRTTDKYVGHLRGKSFLDRSFTYNSNVTFVVFTLMMRGRGVTSVNYVLVLFNMSADKVKLPPMMNCPTCKNNDEVVKIKWGYPTPETLEESKKGNFVLGGCAPYPGIEFSCKKCKNAFGPDAFLEKCPQ